MSDLQKSFVHWRKIFIRINLSLAVIITTVEIVLTISLKFQHLILQNTFWEYASEYLIVPNAIIWGGNFLMSLLFLYVERNKAYFQSKRGPRYECGSLYDDVLNSTLLVMLTITCGTVAYVHYIFHVTVAGFCIPIFLSIVFYSRKACIRTVFICEGMLLAVALHRYARSSAHYDAYILEDYIIAMLLLFVIGNIALNLIKQMKLQYEQMVEAREYAEVANQAKSSFLANMSHEIRTPINAVMGMDEMILRSSDDEEVLNYALDIKKASNSLLSIINDILDVSKIESGKMELLPVEYNLSELIHDVYNNVVVRAKDKGLQLFVEVDEALPNVLIGDDIRIRQILTNLLSNGVKYTQNGSVTLKVSGEMKADGVLLSVMVRDTGIGIKESDIPLLKEKFMRIEEHRNRNIEGTGLGMNIAVSLLDLMGATLNVESEYGVGSAFSFEIMQGIGDTEPIGNLRDRFVELSHVYRKKQEIPWIAPMAKLLVVDDNAMNLKVFNQLLAPFMMRIDQASSGMECLERVKQVRYDMIFLDDMMPGLDGRKTLKLMHEDQENQCANTPVIALTANAVKGAMETYLKDGFDGYLAKPIMPDKLENTILDFLGPELVQYNEPDAESDGIEEAKQPASEGNDSNLEKNTPSLEIPGINWQYGMSVWCNEALLLELIKDFYQELPDALEKLAGWEAAIEEEENMTAFCIRVHALKGGAATIGALNLSSMAYILEMASREKDACKVHQLWPYLCAMMVEYRENLKTLDS